MASVIRLARYRSVARRDIPLEMNRGDSDLRPIAALLWLASLVRVTLTFAHRQTFGAEASLALLCIVFLPLLFVRKRSQRDVGATQPSNKAA